MKNITHFASGLALASFVPGVMSGAAQGSALIALGGLCAMLPDTIDFKLVRYLERADAIIQPNRLSPDAQQMADAIADEMWHASSTRRARVIHLYPARRSSLEWILYKVRFDTSSGDVIVTLMTDDSEGKAHVGAMDFNYDSELSITELGSTSLRFSTSGSKIIVVFLPWHRVWTHSLLIAGILGVAMASILGVQAGIVTFLGYAIHVIEDQLGHIGSALWAPISFRRSSGAGLFHSGDAIPNITLIWLSLTLLLLNMDQTGQTPLLPIGPYLAFVVLLPCLILISTNVSRQWKKHLSQAEAERKRDLVAESQDIG